MNVTDIKNQKVSSTDIELLRSDLINLLLLKYDLMIPSGETPDHVAKRGLLQEAQKWIVLEAIDQAWKQHMLNLDHLKEGIGLRGWGQKNPLLEYKREAFSMFEDMMKGIGYEITHNIFHLNLDRFDSHELEHKREMELEHMNLQGAGGSVDADLVPKADKKGRNELCSCGSGKKHKKCCGK